MGRLHAQLRWRRQRRLHQPDEEYGPDDEIDHLAFDPPYRQLARILPARIARGDWKQRRPISSELQLTQAYGVSRGAVRRAIAVLVEEGLVIVAPKRGTYVK